MGSGDPVQVPRKAVIRELWGGWLWLLLIYFFMLDIFVISFLLACFCEVFIKFPFIARLTKVF